MRGFSLFYSLMINSRTFYFYLFSTLAAAWVIYCYNPFPLYFQNDDFTHILLSSKGELFQRNSFRPVCDLSITLDYYLWGNNPLGYHFVNLVLHIICTGLVFVFSRQIIRLYYGMDKILPAFIASLLFFAYPMHSESVFWILGRSAVLGAIFSLLFLIFFLKERKSIANISLTLVSYALALLTYESSWILPILAVSLVAGVNRIKPIRQKPLRNYFMALACIFCIYLFFRWRVNNEILGNYEGANFLQFNVVVLIQNFGKLLLRSFTSYREIPVVLSISFAVLAALLASVLYVRKLAFIKAKYILLCVVIAVLPYLSLGIDTHGTEGERFLYLPSVFVCLLITIVIIQVPAKRQPGFTAVFTLVYAAQLYINAVNYRFAGSVVKQTLDEIITTPPNSNITVEGLPQAQHGALILTKGLPDAIEFYHLNEKNVSLKILSQRSETLPLNNPYKTVYKAAVKDSAIKYIFTDSALVIYR